MKRIAIIALAAAIGASAHALPLQFDDLVGSGPAIKGIVNGYQDLNWQAVFSLDTSKFSTSTGYGKAAVSPSGAAMVGGSFGRFGSDDQTFDLGIILEDIALRPFITLTSAGVKQGAGQYSFEAQGYNIEGVQVQVYNMAGKRVFSQETSGNRLSWNGLSDKGQRLANGVYLYVMTVKGTYGDVVQTKVQKLAILR